MMGGNDFSVGLDLSSLCNGELNRDFLEEVTELLSKMKKGEKSSINIKVELNRLPDYDTFVGVNYTINSKKPDKSTGSLANLIERGGQLTLMTNEPVVDVPNVSLYDNQAKISKFEKAVK